MDFHTSTMLCSEADPSPAGGTHPRARRHRDAGHLAEGDPKKTSVAGVHAH